MSRRLLVAGIAGLALGVSARATMRVIAWTSGMSGAFSWGGSLEVVMFGALVGAPVALGFVAARSTLPLGAPWAGVIVGSLVFVAFAIVPPPAASSALAGTAAPPLVTALLFWLLFALFGAGLDWYWMGSAKPSRGPKRM